ncbi:DinB family protein [Kibdelosporangium philippinense]|uniref:DinB family protein n=1 Tax=Kibdelosporangium philippinense TaxID=211113 RepID=A0ABS8Z0S7_9PSEU|nr:DinB family protein [Kibdelosporangium philippinense]MCE7001566.1 DinB family protein [Kibdelosporangium philippinense]
MDHCSECGFTYDLTEYPAAAQTISAGVADFVEILRSDANLRNRPSPDVWSPLEYACHVRDVLLVQRERVLLARRTETPVCVPMGRDERAEHEGYNDQEPESVARQLVDSADLFCNVLNRLAEADWQRTLIYSYPEPETKSLQWVAVHTVHEVHHHLLDVRRQLA